MPAVRRILGLVLCTIGLAAADSRAVRLDPEHGLVREGKPFFIKGAGADERYAEVAKRGGNSVRTWGGEGGAARLAEAEKCGLTVCFGIWLEPAEWFRYDSPEHCARQTERVRKIVREFRHHPALLLWGLGNEAEADGKLTAFWQQLDRLAQMVREEDSNHPTLTALAGLSADKAAGLVEHCPHLDAIGINTYAALPSLRAHLAELGWKRPWLVTEFGPRGYWECPKTEWGAPVEQTSTEKAEMIRTVYAQTIAPGGDCLGSYVFIWGQKQEATATWFSLFTKEGEATAMVDAICERWSGPVAQNRAPRLTSLTSPAAKSTLAPGAVFEAEAVADDPDRDPLAYRWEMAAESGGRGPKGAELTPPAFPELIRQTAGSRASLIAPAKAGAYRVFVVVSDGQGHVGTANFPFRVK